MDELKLVVASNLIKLRQKAGKTQVEIGQYLNYSDKTVSKWERAESLPDAYVLSRLAELYGLSVDQLLHEENYWKDYENGVEPPKQPEHMFSSNVVTAVAIMGIWTMAVLMFVIFMLVMNLRLWQIFVCAVSISLLVQLVLNSVWNHGRHNMYIVMLFVATVVAVIVVFLPHYPWQIFWVLIPAEPMIVLGFHITGKRLERLKKFFRKSRKP